MKISRITLVKGIAWTVGFFGLTLALRIVSSVVLTPLLTPEIFGIFVIVYVIQNTIDLLSDVGFGKNLVISKNADKPEFYNTVWSIRLLRGLMLFPICVAAALPLAHLYQAPALAWILPLTGVYFVIEASSSLSVSFLQKRLQTAKLNFFQFATAGIATIGQMAFAYFSPTIWALAFGFLGSAVVETVGSYLVMPDLRHKFFISKEYARQISFIGKWIFLASIIFVLASSYDSLYLGKVIPLQLLGIYGIARNIAQAMNGLVGRVNAAVIFPFIASHSELPRRDFRDQLGVVRAKFMLVAALGFSVLVLISDVLIRILYDYRYHEGGWMLSVMLIGVWFSMISFINDATLIGFGKPHYGAFSFAVKLALLLFGLPLAFMKYGIAGAIVLVVISEISRYIPILVGQAREGFSFVKQDLAMTSLMLALVGLWEWLRWVSGFGTSFESLPIVVNKAFGIG